MIIQDKGKRRKAWRKAWRKGHEGHEGQGQATKGQSKANERPTKGQAKAKQRPSKGQAKAKQGPRKGQAKATKKATPLTAWP